MQPVALGRLVGLLLRKTTLGQRLASAAGVMLLDEHVSWIASLCMLGALQSDDPEAVLWNALVEALGPWALGGRTTAMREVDINALLGAIVSPGGLALGGTTPALRSLVLKAEVERIVSQMDAMGSWSPWPGLVRVKGDQRGLCHRLIAGIVSLLRPIAGERCSTIEDLRLLQLVTDRKWMQATKVGLWDKMGDDAVLLEAEPSWGKTHEAYSHGLRLWRAGLVEGITWVVPTRRAATHVYEHLTGLLPPGAPAAVLGLWEEGAQSGGGRWFLEPSYRWFAAPICVTTMEQAYKAIRTQARHGYTRAAWLSRNLLVVDGLSRADSRNLCASSALMRNQRRVGGYTLAVSSGLDQTGRRVVDLFTRDLREPLDVDPRPVSFEDLPAALTEPAAAVWSWATSVAKLTAARLPRRNTQTFEVRLIEPEDHAAELDRAIDLASRGRRVLRVCNTNRDCRAAAMSILQSTAGARVIARAGPKGLPVTYRSRYPASDLQWIDLQMREQFGISASIRRVAGLLVATGLVDQSVDLSFDVVITDFAPADILLRRMALLSRGLSGAWRQSPELHVLLPSPDALGTVAALYGDVQALERTHLHLTGGPRSFGSGSRALVERVYAGSIGSALKRHLAHARRLAPETHMLAFGTQRAGVEPDPMFPEGEPRQRIVFESGAHSPLGIPLVPMWIRVDEALSPMQTVASYRTQVPTATTTLDVLAWDGALGHRLGSLGYWCVTETDDTVADGSDDV